MVLTVSEPSLDHRADTLIDAIPRGHRRDLHDNDNVLGTGIGPKRVDGERLDEAVLTVYVAEKKDESDLDGRQIIPKEIETPDGETVRTDVEDADGLPAATSSNNTGHKTGSPVRGLRVDPMPGGVEVSHSNGDSGASSALLYDGNDQPVIVSALHIFSSDGVDGADISGETVYQPEAGKSGAEMVGTVADGSRLYADSSRRATCDAVTIGVVEDDISDQYLGYRAADGTGRSGFGQRLVTFSMSSGLVSGDLLDRDVEAQISYPWGETIGLRGLETYENLTASGGSGSMAGHIDPNTGEFTLTAMHFAGSSRLSFLIPWQNIEESLGELRVPSNANTS